MLYLLYLFIRKIELSHYYAFLKLLFYTDSVIVYSLCVATPIGCTCVGVGDRFLVCGVVLGVRFCCRSFMLR